MKKVIYIYWAQKFINAPYIVKQCLLSWRLKNPTWKIIELDDENLCEYINIEKEIPNIKNKEITKTSYSDIIRIFLLAKYGGCWCDATLFCHQSLDIWLHEYISTGFFGFRLGNTEPTNSKVACKLCNDAHFHERMLSSWFLYSEENNYIVKQWKKMTIRYWNKHNKKHKNGYFWFHFLFTELYNSDKEFKKMFDSTSKCKHKTRDIFLLMKNKRDYKNRNEQLTIKLSNEIKNHIDNNDPKSKTPMYKITYKFDEEKYNQNCNLAYLLNTNKLKKR